MCGDKNSPMPGRLTAIWAMRSISRSLFTSGAVEESKRNLIQYQDIKRHRTVKQGGDSEPEYQQLMQLLSDDAIRTRRKSPAPRPLRVNKAVMKQKLPLLFLAFALALARCAALLSRQPP